MNFSTLLQTLSLFVLAAGLTACDNASEINMIPPKGGNGQTDQNCGSLVNCKTAQDSQADRIGSLAAQTAGFSELLLVAAMGEETKGTYSRCITPELSDDGTTLKLTSTSTGMGCRKGADFIKVQLEADIERDSNNRVTKITTRPIENIASSQYSQGLTSHLEVTKSRADQYSISTQLDLDIAIERINAYTYSFKESAAMRAVRTPAPEMLESYSVSEFNITDFSYEGRISFKRGDDDKLVTELNLDTSKDSSNMPTKAFVFNATFETEESKRNPKPKDYKTEFSMYEEVDETRLSNCGVPTGRYHYWTKLSEKESQEASSAYKPKAESLDYLEFTNNRLTAVIAKSSHSITTCNNQVTGRLFNISSQMDELFTEMHKQIGRHSTTQTTQSARGSEAKTVNKTTGRTGGAIEILRYNDDGSCVKRNKAGKESWAPARNCN